MVGEFLFVYADRRTCPSSRKFIRSGFAAIRSDELQARLSDQNQVSIVQAAAVDRTSVHQRSVSAVQVLNRVGAIARKDLNMAALDLAVG